MPTELIPVAQSWEKCVKKANIHGTDAPEVDHEDMPQVMEKYGEAIPQIREIGIWFDAWVTGLKVVYQDDVTMPTPLEIEHFGNLGANGGRYKSITLKKGEYITKVKGKIGSWTDELKITTSRGKVLKAKNEFADDARERLGGADDDYYDPKLKGQSMVVGFNTHWHHHLVKTEVCWIDLWKVDQKQVEAMQPPEISD